MIRSGNEDNFAVDATGDRGLFIVADGMGGHAAGEVASEMAVQIVAARAGARPRPRRARTSCERVRERAQARRTATIHDRTITEVDKQGMGTTASVLMLSGDALPHRPGRRLARVSPSRRRAAAAHEGPLVRAGAGRRRLSHAGAGALPSLQQRDHALRRREPRRRAGHLSRRSAAPATCSSSRATASPAWSTTAGLQQLLMSRAEPERKVHALISEANGRGGLDNITAIVVQVVGDGSGRGRSEPHAGDRAGWLTRRSASGRGAVPRQHPLRDRARGAEPDGAGQGRRAAFYRAIARKLAEAHGRAKRPRTRVEADSRSARRDCVESVSTRRGCVSAGRMLRVNALASRIADLTIAVRRRALYRKHLIRAQRESHVRVEAVRRRRMTRCALETTRAATLGAEQRSALELRLTSSARTSRGGR